MSTTQKILKIITTCADSYGLHADDIIGPCQKRLMVEARGLAMSMSYERTGATYEEVGRVFGGRDHSTVVHALKKQNMRRKAHDVEALITSQLEG